MEPCDERLASCKANSLSPILPMARTLLPESGSGVHDWKWSPKIRQHGAATATPTSPPPRPSACPWLRRCARLAYLRPARRKVVHAPSLSGFQGRQRTVRSFDLTNLGCVRRFLSGFDRGVAGASTSSTQRQLHEHHARGSRLRARSFDSRKAAPSVGRRTHSKALCAPLWSALTTRRRQRFLAASCLSLTVALQALRRRQRSGSSMNTTRASSPPDGAGTSANPSA